MKFGTKSVLRNVAVIALATCLALGVSLVLAGDEGVKERAWLGVVLSQENEGPVKIIEVVEGSPAEAAGLQAGDVVVSVDGAPIETSSEIVGAIRGRQPGDSITLEVRGADGSTRSQSAVLEGRKARAYAFSFDGKDFNVDLGDIQGSIAELQERFGEGQQGFNWMGSGEPQGYMGIGLIQPSDELRQALGALEGEGVLIDKVVEESPAAEAGLRAGDFVVSIDGEKVASTGELSQLVRSKEPGTSVSVGIVRDRAPMTLSVTLGESKNRVFIFRGDGEGTQGFNFAPHHMRFFEGSELKDLDLDFGELHRNIDDVLGNIHIEMHEDAEPGDVKREVIIGTRDGVDA